jgi:hypothetical protein
MLYFINTLGAATGAFVAGFILLPLYGLDGLVTIGAMLNFSISASGLYRGSEVCMSKRLLTPLAKSLSFMIGFISLGTETLWIRTFSFQTSSIA